MAAGEIRAGAAFVELFLKDSRLRKGLLAASKRLKAWGASVRKVGLSVVAAGGAITGALTLALNRFASVGDQLDKTSKRTGVAASALAELGFAAEQSGTDMEAVEKGLFGLSRSLFDAERGSAEAVDALAKIGLNIKQLKGLAPEKQFELVANGLNNIADESVRGAVAQKLLGRSGRQLLPMMRDMAALRQEARDLGLVPEDDAVKAAADVTDAFNRIKRVVGAVIFEVGAALAPAFLDISKKVVGLLAIVGKWVRENKSLVVTIAKVGFVVTAAGVALLTLAGVLTGLGFIAGGLATAIGGIGAVLGVVLSPIGLIAGALVAGIGAWLAWSDSGQQTLSGIQALFGTLWDVFSQTFGGIKAALMSGDFALAGQIALAGLELAFHEGYAAINEMTSGTLEWLRNAFTTAFNAITFAARNWKLMLLIAVQSAAVSIVAFANQVVHFFTEVIPSVLVWFADNWRDIFMDVWNITKTVAGNIWKNLKSLWDGIIGLFKGEGFSFEWTPLTEGFKSAIKELPQIAEREIGPLEKALKDRLDELTGELAEKWTEDQAGSPSTPDARSRDARDKLKNLLDLAEVASKPGPDGQKPADRLAQVGGQDQATAAGRVQGTFNTVAAALFGAGQSAAERTAKATEQTAKHTKETRDRILQLALSAGIR